MNVIDLEISAFPHKHAESFFVSSRNGSLIDPQSYPHSASQQPRIFSKPFQGHLVESNFHQKQVHTFSEVKTQANKIRRENNHKHLQTIIQKWKKVTRAHHMHCMSCRLLCWSPSLVNNTAVFSANPTLKIE